MNGQSSRTEDEIFGDLEGLCASPGYVHALAFLCFRDNYILYGDAIKSSDMSHLFSHSRLIRTEITTLAGLLMKRPIDDSHPGLEVLATYVERTQQLLEELHQAMNRPMFELFENPSRPPPTPFQSAERLREPIFYGGESAYGFQYRDFALLKYAKDDAWLKEHKGFSIADAHRIVGTVARLLDRKLLAIRNSLIDKPPQVWTLLPGISFTAEEVSKEAGLELAKAHRVLEAFALTPGNNSSFTSLHEYNLVSGTPLVRWAHGGYTLFHQYGLFEALYESPFYWLNADKPYTPVALQHRGAFTESFSLDRLIKVFGSEHVHANVDVWRAKGEKLGEIDVLVTFGNRAIVLQAKSKRLTLEARKGNDLQIKADFKAAVQDAYNQARECAVAVLGQNPQLTSADGRPLKLKQRSSLVYPVCVVADHYPALSIQAREFLQAPEAAGLAPPMVADVFALDAMTEMLESPLRLLSYLDLRARFGHRLLAMHEHTLLSFHIKRNLWLNDEFDLVVLEDDIAADLDIAMTARREGLPGAKTPDGILTRIKDTPVGNVIAQIEKMPDPATVDLGLFLLQLSEETVVELNEGIRSIQSLSIQDGKNHDVTIGLAKSSTGLTVHCNAYSMLGAEMGLRAHCERRKYRHKAREWFGLALRPSDGSVWFGLQLSGPWIEDARMEGLVKKLPMAPQRSQGAKKVARNARCPCGSGRKYKNCCAR